MDRIKAHGGALAGAVRQCPLTPFWNNATVVALKTRGQLAVGQVGKVVNDVFRYGLTFAVCRHYLPANPEPFYARYHFGWEITLSSG